MAAQAAGAVALRLVKNKWFWIILGAIILILIIRKNWRYIRAWFSPSKGDFTGAPINPERKAWLESRAEELHKYLSQWGFTSDTDSVLKEIQNVNDDELLYLAKYYKSALTRGNSLYVDIDNKWMPFYGSDEKLLARLSKIGQL